MTNRQTAFLSSSSGTSTVIQQQEAVPWHHRQRGSLPLKKRRFFLDYTDLPPSRHQPSSIMDASTLGFDASKIEPFTTTSTNPLLALVAAASVSSEPSLFSSTAAACVSSTVDHTLPPPPLFSTLIPKEPTPGVTLESSLPSEEDSTTNNKSRPRVHHPPLESPLPNGCHGRTSRNNSYCRRHPCYNGSKYCKLHYQHYIVGSRNEGILVETDQPQQQQRTCSTQQQQHQDKRFTGFAGQVRCQATTTRGRACAYVAVNSTLYCYLHADYDTNPPPRRGGLVSSSKPEELPPMVVTCEKPSSPPSVTSEESCVTNNSSTAAEGKSIVNKSKHPLLSSIASDQWFDKLVLITTGPLINHTGRVVKWGNGWVTVQTSSSPNSKAEGLLHNRRSVELLLLPQDKNEGELRRCVSREADGDAVVPESSEEDIEKIPSREEEEEDAVVETSAVVPATTLSREEPALIPQRSHEDSSETMPERKPESPQSEPCNLEKDHGVSASFSEPHEVTPTPRKRVYQDENDGVPLVESLLAAQQGHRKYNLDLLFGTAALERSRRTVHKPTRYEDTAMLERKRQRLNGAVDNDELPGKRKRVESPRSAKRLSPVKRVS